MVAVHYFCHLIWWSYRLRNCTKHHVFLLYISHIVTKKSYMERKMIGFNCAFYCLAKKSCNLITKQSLHTCWTDCCPSTPQHLLLCPICHTDVELNHSCCFHIIFFLSRDPKRDKSSSLLLLSRVMALRGLL